LLQLFENKIKNKIAGGKAKLLTGFPHTCEKLSEIKVGEWQRTHHTLATPTMALLKSSSVLISSVA
jgi:hypothetical protein